jgi:gold/copper resistance efflux pump
MSFSSFFVQRPIFAVVLSFILMIVGGLALYRLPLSEYPAVSPPTVAVRTAYPGANPKVIADTVAAPLEQEINGVEGMLYMSSQATTNGQMTLNVTFAQGVDPDLAQVQVQNRVSRALPRLPVEVQRAGIVTEKTSPDMLMVVHITSPDEQRDPLYLSNFALLRVRDELSRVAGVGNVLVYGAGEYSMRVWLDPQQLAARSLTASDVVAAIREQNVQVAAGVLGQQPDPTSAFEIAVTTAGRLTDEEQFRQIVIKTGERGQVTRLADVARVELGAQSYALRSLLDAKPAVAIQIVQTPGANALDVSAAVRAKMAELRAAFPSGVDYRIAYDPTIFVRASIDSVLKTLLEAVLLVVLVVILFLQSWRASIIPLAAVPISLVGTAAVMYALGFSLNTLSLFGLVLSIGIVVDDAIVVVENVERHLAAGLSRKEAARRAMREVTGPIIAITSVLAAVFIPTAFIDGLSGQFYRQFAITIAISTVISAFVSLTLSPALAGVLLRGHDAPRDRLTRVIDRLFGGWLFEPFNRFFERSSAAYVGLVRRALRGSAIALLVYAGLIGLTWLGFSEIPRGFVPMQDKYYLVGIAQLPPAASLERTEDVMRRVSELALAEPGVESVVAFPGISINGFANAPNAAVMFAMLDPFEARTSPELSAQAIAGRLMGKLATIQEGFVGIFPPPPVPGLGVVGGFKLQVEDRAGHGAEALYAATQSLVQRAASEPSLAGLMSSYEINAPQLDLDIDRVRAKTHGIALASLFETLQVHMGSLYVNDFNRFGRTYQVNVQAEAPFRDSTADIERLRVRNQRGEMVPLGSLVRLSPSFGPDRVMRYNGYPSADLSGAPAPGYSTGDAVAAMERIALETLPAGMTFEWTELTLQEKLAGRAGLWIFPLAVLLAYLILAAQYNSWTLPLSVLLIVPLALLSALAGVWLTGRANDIFTQIGFVVLVGLAAKNAILIVEFALAREREGEGTVSATLEACKLRLRPILMTSLAFIMGVVPLAFATGAGAEMRQAMGVAVLAGMMGVTLFGLVLTPIFYVIIRRIGALLAGSARSTAVVAAAALLVTGVLTAGATGAAQAQASPSGEKKSLALEEALALALDNNLALRSEALAAERARAGVDGAKAAFDPVLGAAISHARDRRPPRIGPENVEATVFETTLRHRLPTGTEYEVGYGVDRYEADGPLAPDGSSYRAEVRLGLRQPLLRGAWGIAERAAIESSERSEAIANAQLESVTNAILLDTAQAYYRLVRARDALSVARDSQRLAEELAQQTRAQVEVGTLERVELTQAEAGIALRREAVVVAETEVGAASDALASLVYGGAPDAFARELVPAEVAEASAQVVALDEPLRQAKRNRPELAALRLAIENSEAAERVASNATLPDLAAVGLVGVAGADPAIGDAHREAVDRVDRQYRWSLGLELSYPLGNRAASSAHRAARIDARRAQLALDEVQRHIEADVRASVRELNGSIQRVEVTGRAVELASEQLAIERKRLEAGMSTAFQVLRLETDLSVARNAHDRARADHGLRRLDLSRATGVLPDDVRRHASALKR